MSQRSSRSRRGSSFVPLLAFPLVSLAGGVRGLPIPGRLRAAPTGDPQEPLEVVYGRLDDPVAADVLLAELSVSA